MKKALTSIASAAVALSVVSPTVFADDHSQDYVTTTTTKQYIETNHGWVGVKAGPGLRFKTLGRLHLGDKAPLIEKYNRWWDEISFDGQTGYITTSTRFTHVDTETTTTTVEAPWKVEADKVIATAKTQLGAPYYWGHQLPIGSVASGQPYGFDCSNFASWVYNTALGIKFSGSSVYQRYNVGTPVPLCDIREGDLLFVATPHNPTGGGHVGIYEGDGKVIECGGGFGKVAETTLTGNTWFGNNLVFARRVIN